MYELAKSSREKMKAKARALAAAPSLAKGQDTTSATWSPAEALNADAKTGARPVGKARLYKKGGKVAAGKSVVRADRKPRKSGGRVETEIGIGMSNKDVRAANEKREGVKHVGGFKKGGVAKAAGVKEKKALGAVDPSPKRGAAAHYKKGGRTKKEGGGFLENIGNALAGRGYIDGSTWLPKESAASSDSTASIPTSPKRSAAAPAVRRRAPVKAVMDGGYPSAGKTMGNFPPRSSALVEESLDGEKIRNVPTRSSGFGRLISSSDADLSKPDGAKKGGKIKKAKRADGGRLPSPDEAIGSEERLKGIKAMPSKSATPAAQVTPSQLRREEGYSDADRKATRKAGGRAGRADGGAKIDDRMNQAMNAMGKVDTSGYKQVQPYKEPKNPQPAEFELSQLHNRGGRAKRATGGPALSIAGMKMPKKASRKGGKTDINIVINANKPTPQHHAAGMPPAGMPPAGGPPPMMPPGGAPPMPPGMPMGGPGGPGGAPPMPFKKGGRVGKFYGGGMMGQPSTMIGMAGGNMRQPSPMIGMGGGNMRQPSPMVGMGGGNMRQPSPMIGMGAQPSPMISMGAQPSPMFGSAGGGGMAGGNMSQPSTMIGMGNAGVPSAFYPSSTVSSSIAPGGSMGSGMPPAVGVDPGFGIARGGLPPTSMPPAAAPMNFAGGSLPGRKAGGRVTKVASSYKDMEAGAAAGEGRLQKTDIAKHHKDAPARKAGGRISKAAKSYKDMTAGSESGIGRLQKTSIAKAKMIRGK